MTDPIAAAGRDVSARSKRLRVLFLCTHNSARSQIAEAILSRKGRERFIVASAGSDPTNHIHPLTIEALGEYGIDWSGHVPKNVDTLAEELWDLIITVCDRARESCPAFPGEPIFAHWSMQDPSEVQGGIDLQRQAFRDTVTFLSRRIDLLLALPFQSLERGALELRLGSENRDSALD